MSTKDVGALLHGLLFAYQKATKQVLGSGWEIFVNPTLEILAKIDEREGSHLCTGANLDEAMTAYSKMLHDAGIVEKIIFEKIGDNKYLFKVDGCIWAKHIHQELKPKDVTCPLALIAMSMYRKYKNVKVEETESKYLEKGTETVIKSYP